MGLGFRVVLDPRRKARCGWSEGSRCFRRLSTRQQDSGDADGGAQV